jgi:hypothetical protein
VHFKLIPLPLLIILGSSAIGDPRPHVEIRAIYGGVPVQIFERGQSLDDYGINAVWMGSGSINEERFALLKSKGSRVFAEFNTLHDASYLKQHPDAAPVGPDGKVSPPPDGWQGICPSHAGYRKYRMNAFRSVLERFPLDGIWLDYHHSHASWEQAIPNMPDTCFCERCIALFRSETGTSLPDSPTAELAALLLGRHRSQWLRWRTDVFTDWVREFREIVDRTRPGALLGTFHNPWSDSDFNGARLDKLAIDLKSQARYIDVFSPMPYHARFGHSSDPSWISRQTRWLGEYLGIEGKRGERLRIWPIVQLSDWGEAVPVSQVQEALDHGTRPPATGVLVFAWGRLHPSWEKVEELGRFFRSIRP